MAIIEISVVPIGTATPSVSDHVAAVIHKLDALGVEYELNAMGTVIEGDLGPLLDVVRQLHEIPFLHGVSRVYTTIKIDDRRDKKMSGRDKISSVEEKI